MPTLGKSPRGSQAQKALALVLVAGGAVAFLAWRRVHSRAPVPAPVRAAPIAKAPPVAAPKIAPPEPPSSSELLKKAGLRRVSVTIDGPLETALVSQVGRDDGQPLAQLVVRALVWWVEVPSDLRRGDKLEVLFEQKPGEELVVDAVRFSSGKLGRTFRAYRFKPPAARWPRLYQPDGEELETRLAEAPVDDYEQVTSLLRDGRGHKGVDFKTPVGTPVKATFDGVVARKNWHFRGNGNSIEVIESGGLKRHAIFLHLSEVAPEVRPGERVTLGQVIGKSGNTGHSFAPHLHYQLMSSSGEVLDPFASQKTARRKLPAELEPGFAAEVKRLDGLLDAG
jgi:murein DD-endopeptidase MepM/ murein hydrolase activator NlpD